MNNSLTQVDLSASLNVAAFTAGTRVLGPGLRAGVWVQGCPFNCPGCIAPEWIPQVENKRVLVTDLVQAVLSTHVTGLTFSGGEPFLQAEALANLARQVRSVRAVDIIVFTGFSYSALQKRDHAASLLAQTDLLIDGGYIAALDRGVGLRGSDNQQFHFLTHRLRNSGYDFENAPRGLELQFQSSGLLLVGIPVKHTQIKVDHALKSIQEDQ